MDYDNTAVIHVAPAGRDGQIAHSVDGDGTRFERNPNRQSGSTRSPPPAPPRLRPSGAYSDYTPAPRFPQWAVLTVSIALVGVLTAIQIRSDEQEGENGMLSFYFQRWLTSGSATAGMCCHACRYQLYFGEWM